MLMNRNNKANFSSGGLRSGLDSFCEERETSTKPLSTHEPPSNANGKEINWPYYALEAGHNTVGLTVPGEI